MVLVAKKEKLANLMLSPLVLGIPLTTSTELQHSSLWILLAFNGCKENV